LNRPVPELMSALERALAAAGHSPRAQPPETQPPGGKSP
jgi:hypothetical protein